jgi:hypothetical protein
MFFAGSTNEFGPHRILTHVIRIYKPHEVYNYFCTHFAFKTTLCDPFESIRLIIWLISYFVTVNYTDNFYV